MWRLWSTFYVSVIIVILFNISIISTISIAESRIIATNGSFRSRCCSWRTIHIVLVAWSSIVRCLTASHFVLWWSVIRVVDIWSRYAICWAHTAFEVYNGWALLLIIYIIIITCRSKWNIPSLLHWGLCDRAIVDVAVGVERWLYFSVGGGMWVAVGVLLIVLRQPSHYFLSVLRLSELCCKLSNSF